MDAQATCSGSFTQSDLGPVVELPSLLLEPEQVNRGSRQPAPPRDRSGSALRAQVLPENRRFWTMPLCPAGSLRFTDVPGNSNGASSQSSGLRGVAARQRTRGAVRREILQARNYIG
jgi:hypothetical protein